MKKGKLLIIDDNEDILFALNLLLEPYMEQIIVELQYMILGKTNKGQNEKKS